MILQGLMQPFLVVKVEVAAQAVMRFLRVGIVVQVDFFVLDTAPQAFGQNVVQGTPPPIHADPNLRGREQLDVLRAREVAPLVTVPDLGLGLRQGPLHGGQDEGHFQGLGQFPTQHIAGVPIEHRDEIEPALQETNIRDIDAPDLIRVINRQMPQ